MGQPSGHVGGERLLLGAGGAVRAVQHGTGQHDRRVAHRGPLGVGHLACGDAVHERGERPALVPEPGQRVQDRDADLLADVVGGGVPAADPAEVRAAVPHDARPDQLKQVRRRVRIAPYRALDELRIRSGHERRSPCGPRRRPPLFLNGNFARPPAPCGGAMHH